jgi:oligoendopeptidase F
MSLRLWCVMAMLVVSVASAAQPVPAAEPSAADREAQRYRFKLERNFFPSPEAEVAARAGVLRAAEELTALVGKIDSPAALLKAFELDDQAQRLFRRHDLYHFLRYATDIRREEGLQAADELRGKVRASRQALRRAVAARDDAWLNSAIAAQPKLARYRFWLDTIRRDARHTLGSEQQAVVSALEPLLGARDYPRIVNALKFGTVEAGGRRLDARRDRSEIEASPSPEVRREGTRQLFAGYATQRDLLAYMLVQTIEVSNAIARLKGHGSALDEATFDAYVTPAHFEAVLAEVARHGATYKEWQRKVGDPFASAGRWTASRAAAAVATSAAPLGAAYQREYADLFNPELGRADLGRGEHRLPMTGTASVYPTGSSSIYMNAFEGGLLDLIVLAHEGGHAVQAQLMFRNNVPMAYAAGPGYFTESFGRFQELLLLDHLHATARTPEEKKRMRDAFAARLLSVFPSAEEASVELAIHKAVGEGKARSADDLDAVTAASGALYSVEYERTPERRGLWQLSEGYFMAPLQELNDAYASLLAIRYFQLYRRDPAAFRTAYLALISNGYGAEPGQLLQRYLGFDMMAPEFTQQTMAALEAQVEALYR